jgi:hypothetical protein
MTLSITDDQRVRLIEFIADRYLDNMDSRDLERFFLDEQLNYLKEFNDEELITELEDITHDDEYEEIIGDLTK